MEYGYYYFIFYVNNLHVVPTSFWNTDQTFPCIFINQVEPTYFLSVSKSVFHKAIAPDMVLIFRTKSNATSVIEPQPAFLRLFLRHLEPLCSPKDITPIIHGIRLRNTSHCDRFRQADYSYSVILAITEFFSLTDFGTVGSYVTIIIQNLTPIFLI